MKPSLAIGLNDLFDAFTRGLVVAGLLVAGSLPPSVAFGHGGGGGQ